MAEPVIDVHGHAIVPAAMALAGPEPAAQAARAAEAALFGPETQAVQEAMIARIGPLLVDVGTAWRRWTQPASTSRS